MLDIDPGFADQLDLDLPVDDLGVWIDPIGRSAGVYLIHRKNMMIFISHFFLSNHVTRLNNNYSNTIYLINLI